jgi:hypothetical protein
MAGKADGRGTLRQAVLAALGYIAIMAVGMFTSGPVFGIEYGTPEMTLVLLPFEVAAVLGATEQAVDDWALQLAQLRLLRLRSRSCWGGQPSHRARLALLERSVRGGIRLNTARLAKTSSALF